MTQLNSRLASQELGNLRVSGAGGFGGVLRDLIALTKPTIAILVVVTAFPTLLMVSDTAPSLSIILSCLVGTFLAACSAGTFNQVVDFDIDRGMNRTKGRPVARGRVTKALAITWATGLGLISFALLYWGTTPLAAYLALLANAFYVLFYTMYLKRRTVQNIVIGGAAGAVGPLIGWAAVDGTLSLSAWLLFLVIFLWTPPHFWALALKYKDDYARAGIPMYPVIHGDRPTRRAIFWYTVSLVPTMLALYWTEAFGNVSFAASMAFTLYFCYLASKLLRSQNNRSAMALFHYSCIYVFGVFGALTLERLWMLSSGV